MWWSHPQHWNKFGNDTSAVVFLRSFIHLSIMMQRAASSWSKGKAFLVSMLILAAALQGKPSCWASGRLQHPTPWLYTITDDSSHKRSNVTHNSRGRRRTTVGYIVIRSTEMRRWTHNRIKDSGGSHKLHFGWGQRDRVERDEASFLLHAAQLNIRQYRSRHDIFPWYLWCDRWSLGWWASACTIISAPRVKLGRRAMWLFGGGGTLYFESHSHLNLIWSLPPMTTSCFSLSSFSFFVTRMMMTITSPPTEAWK